MCVFARANVRACTRLCKHTQACGEGVLGGADYFSQNLERIVEILSSGWSLRPVPFHGDISFPPLPLPACNKRPQLISQGFQGGFKTTPCGSLSSLTPSLPPNTPHPIPASIKEGM